MLAAVPFCTSRASADRSRSVAKNSADSFSIAVATGLLPCSGVLNENQASVRQAANRRMAPAIASGFLYFSKDLSIDSLSQSSGIPVVVPDAVAKLRASGRRRGRSAHGEAGSRVRGADRF